MSGIPSDFDTEIDRAPEDAERELSMCSQCEETFDENEIFMNRSGDLVCTKCLGED